MNLIESTSEHPRALALGEGIVLSENLSTVVASTEVVGMRIGFHVSNTLNDLNQVRIHGQIDLRTRG